MWSGVGPLWPPALALGTLDWHLRLMPIGIPHLVSSAILSLRGKPSPVCPIPFRLLITNRGTRPVPLRIVLLIPQQEQPLSQVSQLSQLPRQRLIPQTTRIPIHKQHLSQVSQLSQCTLFGEELLAYAFCLRRSTTLEALF